MTNAFLMFGYFHDPFHICFYLCSGYINSADPELVPQQELQSMSLVKVLDVCLTIDIVVTALTSYQKDAAEYEDEILKVIWNYASGTMIFDIAATIPALFLNQNSGAFYLKLIRFIHVRSVFGCLS